MFFSRFDEIIQLKIRFAWPYPRHIYTVALIAPIRSNEKSLHPSNLLCSQLIAQRNKLFLV